MKEKKSISAAFTAETDPLDRMMQSCSLWYKLKKLMTWILRYRSNLLRECRSGKEDKAKVLTSEKPCPISVEEMHSAEIESLKCVCKGKASQRSYHACRNGQKKVC